MSESLSSPQPTSNSQGPTSPPTEVKGAKSETPNSIPSSPQSKTKADTSRGIGELLNSLSNQVNTMITGEIQLAKNKFKAMVTKAGVGGALLAAAAVLALYLLGLLLWAGAYGFAILCGGRMWAGILLMALVLLVAISILAGIGALMIRKSQEDKPDPKASFSRSVDAFKKGLGK